MYEPVDDRPLLPPKPRDGIERAVKWFFSGVVILAVFALIVVGFRYADESATSTQAGDDEPAVEKPIDLGSIPD